MGTPDDTAIDVGAGPPLASRARHHNIHLALVAALLLADLVFISTVRHRRRAVDAATRTIARLSADADKMMSESVPAVEASLTTFSSMLVRDTVAAQQRGAIERQTAYVARGVSDLPREHRTAHEQWKKAFEKQLDAARLEFRRREVKVVARLARDRRNAKAKRTPGDAPQGTPAPREDHSASPAPPRAPDLKWGPQTTLDRSDAFEERAAQDEVLDVDDHPGPAYVPLPDEILDKDLFVQNALRREAVLTEFTHSWNAYKRYAWGSDELRPVSRAARNWTGAGRPSLSLTLLDASTTLALMGLDGEVAEVIRYVQEDFRSDIDADVSQFETTIRALGALLSLYELTGEKHPSILKKAEDLGRRLLAAYATPSGIPDTNVNLLHLNHSNPAWRSGCTALSEAGSVQLEMKTLSFHTRDGCFDVAAMRALGAIEARVPRDQLPRLFVNVTDGSSPVDWVSLGALGDSYFEYALKLYLISNRTLLHHKIRFKQIVAAVERLLLQFSSGSPQLAYISGRIAKGRRSKLDRKMDHLSCFFPGVLALAAQELHRTSDEFDRWMKLAGELTETCIQMYVRQQTGIAPEFVVFPDGEEMTNGDGFYLLRPETFEALFYMWRTTKDQRWRDVGWQLFRSIRRFCRVPGGGYSGLRQVNVPDPAWDDVMPSYWLAETLKYAYLLFSPDEALDIQGEWVLNTEAHPLRIRDFFYASCDRPEKQY